MWAVSRAIESARESIWILDCRCRWVEFSHFIIISLIIYFQGWLSPELYLRRPPAKYDQYRLDRMLEAAASRGVKVKIIVYKEVSLDILFVSQ